MATVAEQRRKLREVLTGYARVATEMREQVVAVAPGLATIDDPRWRELQDALATAGRLALELSRDTERHVP